MVRGIALTALLLAAGCRGSGVPWRVVEAELEKARVEIEINVKWTGGVDARLDVDASQGSATLHFDREAAKP